MNNLYLLLKNTPLSKLRAQTNQKLPHTNEVIAKLTNPKTTSTDYLEAIRTLYFETTESAFFNKVSDKTNVLIHENPLMIAIKIADPTYSPNQEQILFKKNIRLLDIKKQTIYLDDIHTQLLEELILLEKENNFITLAKIIFLFPEKHQARLQTELTKHILIHLLGENPYFQRTLRKYSSGDEVGTLPASTITSPDSSTTNILLELHKENIDLLDLNPDREVDIIMSQIKMDTGFNSRPIQTATPIQGMSAHSVIELINTKETIHSPKPEEHCTPSP